MKKIMYLLFSSISIIALSGCGGGGGTTPPSGGGTPPSNILSEINILDLDLGYVIEGTSSYGNDVVLTYCHGVYDYERIPGSHYTGTYTITNNDITISMYDHDGGSYRIDTPNGLLEVGEFYDIFDLADDITVTDMYENLNC